ncbi:MAG: DUF6675 family protein [Spirochaetales bacterium]
MKKNFKKCTLGFFFAFFSMFIFSQENESLRLDDLFSSDVVRQLQEEGFVQRNFYGEKNITLDLAPNTILGNQALNYWQRKDEPVFIVESLYFLEKNNANEENTVEKISVILRSLSQMTGIEYFSTSRQIYEVLYTDVYTVNNAKDKVKIADHTEGSAANLVSYVYQKDRSLSGTVYEFSYFQNDNEVSFRAINTEKILYKNFLSIVSPENLVMTLIATDVGDSVVFYVLVQADVPKIPFVSERLANSFSSRADAIFNWCMEMYKKSEE